MISKRKKDEITPTTRMWRTLISLDCINEEAQVVGLRIPGWDPYKKVYVHMSEIPSQVLSDLRSHGKNYRFFAEANKGERDPAKIVIDFKKYERPK